MERKEKQTSPTPSVKGKNVAEAKKVEADKAAEEWRRRCGCLKTSDKLKEVLKNFPGPPPPTPASQDDAYCYPYDANCPTDTKCLYPTSFAYNEHCISSECKGHADRPAAVVPMHAQFIKHYEYPYHHEDYAKKELHSRIWIIVADLVRLLQLSVTATALALYYLIYCYMQLVYYTLRSALYFHHADGPMKVTIGIVTITSVVVGFNLVIRMERLIGIF